MMELKAEINSQLASAHAQLAALMLRRSAAARRTTDASRAAACLSKLATSNHLGPRLVAAGLNHKVHSALQVALPWLLRTQRASPSERLVQSGSPDQDPCSATPLLLAERQPIEAPGCLCWQERENTISLPIVEPPGKLALRHEEEHGVAWGGVKRASSTPVNRGPWLQKWLQGRPSGDSGQAVRRSFPVQVAGADTRI